MRVKTDLILFGAFFFLLFACPLLFARNVEAAEMNFGQKIMPVRFVYVDQKGEISKIWSNVTDSDSEYVVKFFAEKRGNEKGSEKEISSSKELVKKYETKISRTKTEFEKKISGAPFLDSSIDFVNKGKTLEEVQTYL